MNEIIIEHMAKAGYETMFEESWHDVHTLGIEGDLWRNIARNMLRIYEQHTIKRSDEEAK